MIAHVCMCVCECVFFFLKAQGSEKDETEEADLYNCLICCIVLLVHVYVVNSECDKWWFCYYVLSS